MVNSSGCRVTAKPACAAIDWMIEPICSSSGAFSTMSETWIGVLSPVAAMRLFASATFWVEHGTFTAHGLFGGIGVQPGVYSPSKATWFSSVRFSDNSNASRSVGCVANGLSAVPYGLSVPVHVAGVDVKAS